MRKNFIVRVIIRVISMQVISAVFVFSVPAHEPLSVSHTAPNPVHLAYTLGPFVKYAKWENGAVTERQLIDSTGYAKGFLDLKKDEEGGIYLAYAINRNPYNTHWFVMLKDFQTGILEALPVPSPFIPLGVALQIQGTGAQKELLVTVALQELGLPYNVQQVYLFRKSSGTPNWNFTYLFSNYQQALAIEPHVDTALDRQGVLHVFFSQKQISTSTVSVHELLYDLNQQSVLDDYTISTAASLSLQGPADRFYPLDGELSSADAFSVFSTNPDLIIAQRAMLAPNTWQFLTNFTQVLGADLEIYQHVSDDYMVLAAVENGQFIKGGTDLNFYFSSKKVLNWNRIPITQGKIYYSPSVSIPKNFPDENIFIACTTEESSFISTLYLYTHAPYDLRHWGAVVIDRDVSLNPEINHIRILQ